MAVTQPPSQGKRRAMYGFNVAIAIAAALVVVVLINLLVDWQYRRLNPSLREWARYDLTATRSQTLSPQTRKVLAALDDDVELISLVRVENQQAQSLSDLLSEYARYSNRLSVDFIHPERDRARLDALLLRIAERFADETIALRDAVNQGLDLVEKESEQLGVFAQRFTELAENDEVKDQTLRDRLRVLGLRLEETRENYVEAEQKLAASMDRPLPPLSNLRFDLVNALRRLDTEVLKPYQDIFKAFGRSRNTPMSVRNALIELDAQVGAMRGRVQPMIETLTSPVGSARYDRMVAAMAGGELVMVWGQGHERALPLAELFVTESTEDGGASAPSLIAEERLTGALLMMGMPEPPRVIFVRDTPVSLVGKRGGYQQVASRLAANGFELAEWSLAGTADGQAVSAPPIPGAGQQGVWVVPPLDAQRSTVAQREMVAELLSQRLKAGDGVLLNFAYDPEALYRPADPLAGLAKKWGLDVQRQRIILREGISADGRPQADASAIVDDWPGESPLGFALAGRTARFVLASPVQLDELDGVSARPLVELEGSRQWIANELSSGDAVRAARYADDTAAPTATVMAAAWREDHGRLVASGDPFWATDSLTANQLGNAELFMNSIYWLSNLDEAIAATPRTQTIRRVDPMSDQAQLWARLALLAGMPLFAVLAGSGVWLIRRRG